MPEVRESVSTTLLVDANGLAHHCWWATPKGYLLAFSRAIERAKPHDAEIIICWDALDGSWRRDLFPAYKANRPPKPAALKAALDDLRRTWKGPMVHGFEADDVIGTLARAAGPDDLTVILSSDKDLFQLVTPRCFVVTYDGTLYDEDGVQQKMGVPPNRIRHLLSWMGDASDGLPGVQGIGPKRGAEKALKGEIGYQLTYDLTALADVPKEAIFWPVS